jgi:RNA polymerase sigma-54 factor
MGLAAKLVMRQGQAMALTPQLLQAIKLLQLPALELADLLREELQRNPFLEVAVDPENSAALGGPEEASPGEDADWLASDLKVDESSAAPEGDSGADDPPGTAAASSGKDTDLGDPVRIDTWAGGTASSGETDGEITLPESITLAEHLRRQAGPLFLGPAEKMALDAFIDALDESGYLREPLGALADTLGLTHLEAERRLKLLQGLEPSGVFARDLAECLMLQLQELGRLDPAMAVLLQNLAMLAERDFVGLQKLCGVDAEDLSEMVAEIKRLNPKPGLAFQGFEPPLAPPDVIVRPAPGDNWLVELNEGVLPKVVVNSVLAAYVGRSRLRAEERTLVASQIQSANWLVRSVEQRSRTVLAVATEIVRRQDAFLTVGVRGLRPLTLKAVADAIGVHESTVSRAAAEKTVQTPRGVFEMKRFFSNAVAGKDGGETHSAASVRHRIKAMIAGEAPDGVLSDDAIVEKLSEAGVIVARRTVAKYREGMKIPSSVERRRIKRPGLHANIAVKPANMGSAGASREPSIDLRFSRT